MGALSEGLQRALERVPPWAWLLPVFLLLVVGLRYGIRLSRWVLALRTARARRTGRKGAARALEMLRRDRWNVLATEVVREGAVEVDGRLETFVVRADALVEK